MYLGKIVELAPASELYANPLHPYTGALLSAIPVPDPEHRKKRILLEGDVPTPINPPPGCRFKNRCPIGREKEICGVDEPVFREYDTGHFAACHFSDQTQFIFSV